MPFEFAAPGQVIFGWGTLEQAGGVASRLGRRALVVTGGTPERAERLLGVLAGHGLHFTLFAQDAEPSVESVTQAAEEAQETGCDLVIGFGGGSAVDAGKAAAALAANEGELLDYLEVIGEGKALARPPLPYVAIPTTAGTGAEATRNAVIASPEHALKVSLRSPLMLPRIALVDPELTLSVSPAVTASTGMDALAQLIEAFVCRRANPVTDAFCREGMTRAARSLQRVFEDGQDMRAREDMSLAALLSGMALANAGLGAVHGFAAALGGLAEAPHGALCARLLPRVMAANLKALGAREPHNPILGRYAEVARILTGLPDAPPEEGIAWAEELLQRLQIPRLGAYAFSREDFDIVCERASRASSMQANPVLLTAAELRDIMDRSC